MRSAPEKSSPRVNSEGAKIVEIDAAFADFNPILLSSIATTFSGLTFKSCSAILYRSGAGLLCTFNFGVEMTEKFFEPHLPKLEKIIS